MLPETSTQRIIAPVQQCFGLQTMVGLVVRQVGSILDMVMDLQHLRQLYMLKIQSTPLSL